MRLTFDLPPLARGETSLRENAGYLRASFDFLIALNRGYLQHHAVPSLYAMHRAGRLVYGRTDEWDSIPALYVRGYGDCKSLACARIAELAHAGRLATPEFRFVPNARDGFNYHVLVRTGRDVEDPSKVLGMGQDENAHF